MGRYETRLNELRQLIDRLRWLEALPHQIREQETRFHQIISQEKRALIGLKEDLEVRSETLDAREEAIHRLATEKTDGFPWLADAYNEFLGWQDDLLADILRVKRREAPKASEAVRGISSARRLTERRAKVLEYKLRYYESLFPWLTDLTGEDIDDLLISLNHVEQSEENGEKDPAKQWLTDGEYAQLPTSDKYQLALDRYWRKRKRPWEIGRDYERYVGYLYEKKGLRVHYQGIVEGLQDLGRDLIAGKGDSVEIVQCKNWSKDKTIHEKHIFQLFGTVTAYRIDHPQETVTGTFCTSTALSDRAKQFADTLGIRMIENFPLQRYPCIKCNVSMRDGTKIYHLPFDQQYDRTIIEEERPERYVETVAEAETLGFRRAYRWRGASSEQAP